MTEEEKKRERLLKRILPCISITIIYFVFISGGLSENMSKAEGDYTAIKRRGITTSSVPSVIQEQNKTQSQINEFKKQHNELKNKLKNLAGFLSNETPSNESSILLSRILAENNIRVKNEQRKSYAEDKLNLALKEVWQWLKPETTKPEGNEKKSTDIFVQHLQLTSSYQDMYSAMAIIAKGELKAVPVSFSMRATTDESPKTGDLDWELLLWM